MTVTRSVSAKADQGLPTSIPALETRKQDEETVDAIVLEGCRPVDGQSSSNAKEAVGATASSGGEHQAVVEAAPPLPSYEPDEAEIARRTAILDKLMAEHSAQMADQEAARRVRLGLPAIPSKGNAEGESAVASTSRTPSTTTQKASETRVNAQDLASAEKNRIAPVKKRAAALPSSSSRGISSSKLKLPLNIWSIIIADDSLSYFDLKCLQRVCQRFRALVRMPKLDHRLFRQRPRRDLLPHEDDSSWGEDLRGLHPILKYTNFHANKLDDFTADLHHSTGSKKFIVARHSVANEMATSPPSTTLRLAVFDEYQTVVKNSFGVTVLDVIKAAIKQWNAPCDPYQWDGLAEFASGAPMTWSDDEEEDMYGNDEKGDPTHWNVTQKTSGGAMVWREWAELFWDEELGPHLLGPPMHEMHPGDW